MAGLAPYVQEGRPPRPTIQKIFLHPTVFDGLALITLFFSLNLIIHSFCPD